MQLAAGKMQAPGSLTGHPRMAPPAIPRKSTVTVTGTAAAESTPAQLSAKSSSISNAMKSTSISSKNLFDLTIRSERKKARMDHIMLLRTFAALMMKTKAYNQVVL